MMENFYELYTYYQYLPIITIRYLFWQVNNYLRVDNIIIVICIIVI